MNKDYFTIPESLLREISNRIDPEIRDFFLRYCPYEDPEAAYSRECTALIQHVILEPVSRYTTWDYFHQYKRRTLRKKWYQRLFENLDRFSVSSERSMFYSLYQKKMDLPAREWEALYGKMTMKEIILKETEPVKEWSEHGIRMLECPMMEDFIRWHGSHFINAFKSDATIDIFRILKEMCNFDIKQLVGAYTDDIRDLPLFHAGTHERENTYFEYGEWRLVAVSSYRALEEGRPPVSFDAHDQENLIRLLVKGVESDPADELRILPRELPSLPWDEIVSRVSNLTCIDHFLYKNNVFQRSIRFVEAMREVKAHWNKPPSLRIRLKKDAVDAIKTGQIHWFYLDDYLRLENTTARILFPRLHSDRLSDLSEKRYTFEDVRSMGVTSSYPEAKHEVDQALQLMQEKHIIVQLWHSDDGWEVTFLPLSEKEQMDIKWLR